ncbi:hypothetical protein [Pseudobutyrivibrio sp.]|uniref:hypothetical protein n=1 Tax=Pseudobutyrivibrio sp. TaxID=2014367 RepID=UPI001D7E2321|nr:hypothetical protein [Pseudobutyrivibrio sp.]MBE5910130.1 hypothetical protein [Pseudobutyrivibrio sp.]
MPGYNKNDLTTIRAIEIALSKRLDGIDIEKVKSKDIQVYLGVIYAYTVTRKADWDATMKELSADKEKNAEVLDSLEKILRTQDLLEKEFQKKREATEKRYEELAKEYNSPEELEKQKQILEADLAKREQYKRNLIVNPPVRDNNPKPRKKRSDKFVYKNDNPKPSSQLEHNVMKEASYTDEKRRQSKKAKYDEALLKYNLTEKHQGLAIRKYKYEDIIKKEDQILFSKRNFTEMVDVVCAEVEEGLNESIISASQNKDNKISQAEKDYRKKIDNIINEDEYKKASKEEAPKILERRTTEIYAQMNNDPQLKAKKEQIEAEWTEKVNKYVKKADDATKELWAESLTHSLESRKNRRREYAKDFWDEVRHEWGILNNKKGFEKVEVKHLKSAIKADADTRKERIKRAIDNKEVKVVPNVIGANKTEFKSAEIKPSVSNVFPKLEFETRVVTVNDQRTTIELQLAEKKQEAAKDDVKLEKKITTNQEHASGEQKKAVEVVKLEERISTNKGLLGRIEKMANDDVHLDKNMYYKAKGGFVGDEKTTYVMSGINSYKRISQREVAACEFTFYQDKKEFRIGKEDHFIRLQAIHNLLRKNKKFGLTSNSKEYEDVLNKLDEFEKAVKENGWDRLLAPDKQDITKLSPEELQARHKMVNKLHEVYMTGRDYMIAKGPQAKSWGHGQARYELMYMLCNEIYTFGGHAAEAESRLNVVYKAIDEDKITLSTYTKQISNQADATERLNIKYRKYISDEIKKINSNKVIPNDLDNVANNQNNKEQINNINRNLIM